LFQSATKIVAAPVNELLNAGVMPNRITKLGFFRGGYITALALSLPDVGAG
jgi:hypothetical protein